MEREQVKAWIEEISSVTSVWLKLNMEETFLKIESCYRNTYMMKPGDILTIRSIDEDFLIKTNGGFLYIDTSDNKIITGI